MTRAIDAHELLTIGAARTTQWRCKGADGSFTMTAKTATLTKITFTREFFASLVIFEAFVKVPFMR